jgi:hypothetical protein
MKLATAMIMLALTLCARPARAQLVDDSLGAQQKLADAGYRYDDLASLLRALQDQDELVAIFATTFLAERATAETIGALRAASEGPRESLALGAFGALQRLGATGWEGSAIGLMQGTREETIRVELAGILAKAGRTEGWLLIRDALTPDNRLMRLALFSVGPFHGLKAADGTTIDAISELRRLQRELRDRGRASDASQVETHIAEADRWSRRTRGRAR